MKNIKLYILIILLLNLGANSCIEPIDPETLVFEDLLVVEALITDELKSHSVKLSRSFELDENEVRIESGARVWIEREDGEIYDLQEIKPGEYYSVPFAALSEFRYRLNIETAGGSEVQSTWEELKKSPPIENIRATFEPDIETGEGVFSFFLDTEKSDETDFFRWEWTDTYRIEVNHASTLYWDGQQLINRRPYTELRYCFAFDTLSNILVASSLEDGQIRNFLVNKFHSTNQKLVRRYSIEVKQYGLDEEAFRFWELIKTNSDEQGGLFDQQPGTIPGNLESVNSNQTVLGLFEVSEVNSMRVFYSSLEFEEQGYRPSHRYILKCSDEIDVISLTSISEVPRFVEEFGDRYIPWFISTGMIAPPGILFTKKECGDCREFGVLETPDYWIE